MKSPMKFPLIKGFYTLLFLLFTFCILSHSDISLYYAILGLNLWFEKMIPALLPFMILSGIVIRMKLTGSFVKIIYPLLNPIFRVSPNVCYCLLIGFLCGFPMGAKTVADMYSEHMINKREAEYLLAFCNNIGPVYFTGFVLPLLERRLILPYLLGMYGIPLGYGIVLRYTRFRSLTYLTDTLSKPAKIHSELRMAKQPSDTRTPALLQAVDEAITSAVGSILTLGGYMILFNLLNLLPHSLLGHTPVILAPLFEISGGLYLLQKSFPLYPLLLLPFGGLSCIAQTGSCIRHTDLSISDYTLHKFIITVLTAAYYLLWYIIFPQSFLH